MTEKHYLDKLNMLLEHIEDPKQKQHYFRLISTLLEKGYFPGLAEVPIVKSSISHIDGEKGLLTYRGYPVEELASNCSFEVVSYLILNGDLPLEAEEEKLRGKLLDNIYIPDDVATLICNFNRKLHPMNMLSAAVLLLEAHDKGSADVDNHFENLSRSIKLIAKIPTIIGTFLTGNPQFNRGKQFKTFAEYALFCFNPKLANDSDYVKMFEESLILHMDHTMNNSTFSARAVGSAKAGIYALISTAINSLSGPLHGGANERVVQTLEKIGSAAQVPVHLENSLEHHQKIMGVGHRIYKTYDPRAKYFKEFILPKIFGDPEQVKNENPPLWNLYDTAIAMEKYVQERLGKKNLYPNVDFWSGLFYKALGVPTEYFTTIFAMARSVGWLAHWMEQQESAGKIYRPYQLYAGFDTRHIVK
ncbi:MAG TPA: citrate/2-methylcitrate synthase [Bacillota bacterium]|nr:citrate/2-methylcitrate synthase [Bacillota bacterium]HOL08695.1 citrate/2-methylcitrate synthase [Bacillota bacterium]HPO96402.1 citrate/2-methylcitrate synthase [Bacillota bacterium]